MKTATPMINSSALTRKAIDNWILESQVEKRTACATSSSFGDRSSEFVKLLNEDISYAA